MDAPITITLPDGSHREYPAGTTAADVAGVDRQASRQGGRRGDRVDGHEVDLGRPLDDGDEVAIITDDTPTTAATCCATRRRT